jgi:hypothetical protein
MKRQDCEIPACKSTGGKKAAVGIYQVYDEDVATMNRPAAMCAGCVQFASSCGMTPRKVAGVQPVRDVPT